jgi:hypothetical protein
VGSRCLWDGRVFFTGARASDVAMVDLGKAQLRPSLKRCGESYMSRRGVYAHVAEFDGGNVA